MSNTGRPPAASADSPSKLNWKPRVDDSLRRRRWHSRVFTGCVTCRRRHVKCDERAPMCSNCQRLSLDCNYDRKFVFRAVHAPGPPGTATFMAEYEMPEGSEKASPPPGSSGSSGPSSTSAVSASGSDDEATDESQTLATFRSTHGARFPGMSIIDIPKGKPTNNGPFPFNRDGNFNCSGPSGHLGPRMLKQVFSPADLYTRHFLDTVSAYLIVYDTESNCNPFRLLPSLIRTSGLLDEAIKALGAMHIAALPQTRNWRVHHDAATKAYGDAVVKLRNMVGSSHAQPSLEILATTLLFCMFEKMCGHDASWRIHLIGAGHILQSMYSPRICPVNEGTDSAGDEGSSSSSSTSGSISGDRGVVSAEDHLPLQRFLVSLMSYLDVAAACATGDGTVISGDYWETLGGGWEYNLGAPSFTGAAKLPGERVMAQIRHSWSRMMSIQTDISRFAKLDRQGVENRQRHMYYHNLKARISTWQESVPDIYVQLSEIERMPDDVGSDEHEALIAAACVQAYALACGVHLDRVLKRRIGTAAQDPDIAAAVSRILTLVFNFQKGINQLSAVWPVMTAGIATTDPMQQESIRQHLQGMKGFAFQHITRALETLEYTWSRGRQFGGVNYEEFEMLISKLIE